MVVCISIKSQEFPCWSVRADGGDGIGVSGQCHQWVVPCGDQGTCVLLSCAPTTASLITMRTMVSTILKCYTLTLHTTYCLEPELKSRDAQEAKLEHGIMLSSSKYAIYMNFWLNSYKVPCNCGPDWVQRGVAKIILNNSLLQNLCNGNKIWQSVLFCSFDKNLKGKLQIDINIFLLVPIIVLY